MTPEQGAEMEEKLKLTEAIINSMTPGERRDHGLLNGSRRKRIAKGSGTSVQEVNQMINEYLDMRKMMRMMTSGGLGGIGGRLLGGLAWVEEACPARAEATAGKPPNEGRKRNAERRAFCYNNGFRTGRESQRTASPSLKKRRLQNSIAEPQRAIS